MKTTLKLSLFLLIFGSFSCSISPEKENVLPQNNSKTTTDFSNAARTNPNVNTITLRTITNDIKRPPAAILISFESGKQTQAQGFGERKGWDGTIKGSNFAVNQNGIVLFELSPDDMAPGNPLFIPGDPIPGVGVNLGRRPGGQTQMRLTSDKNGEIVLPEDLQDGDYFIIIGEKENISEFNLSIKNGKIKEVDAPKMLVNQDGTVRNFYYEEDFKLDAEIAKNLEADEIIIEKGFYPVDYSNKGEGGTVVMRGKVKGKITVIGDKGKLIYEGTNPKGQDCKNWGTACFYVSGERGVDKKDIRRFTVVPALEKELFVGVEIHFLDDLNGLIR